MQRFPMADEQVIKIAIAPLATTAYTTKQPRKRKAKTEQFLGKKRETDRARNKTRVNIGGAFRRWRGLMELKEMKSDSQMALFLLDRYIVFTFWCYETHYFWLFVGYHSWLPEQSPDTTAPAKALTESQELNTAQQDCHENCDTTVDPSWMCWAHSCTCCKWPLVLSHMLTKQHNRTDWPIFTKNDFCMHTCKCDSKLSLKKVH